MGRPDIVAKFFELSISCIIWAIEDQSVRQSIKRNQSKLNLICAYRILELVYHLTVCLFGLRLCCKQLALLTTKKSLDWLLVTTRVSKYTCGIVQDIPFDKKDMEHLIQLPLCFRNPLGQVCLHSSFSVISQIDTSVQEFWDSYWEDHPVPHDFGKLLATKLPLLDCLGVQPHGWGMVVLHCLTSCPWRIGGGGVVGCLVGGLGQLWMLSQCPFVWHLGNLWERPSSKSRLKRKGKEVPEMSVSVSKWCA